MAIHINVNFACVQVLYFSVSRWMWVAFHLIRTICIIEPCHMVSVEVMDPFVSLSIAVYFIFIGRSG